MRAVVGWLVLAALAGCDKPGGPVDADRDGYAADDCDDGDPAVHPGAPEVCDGVDDDCDGTADQGAVDTPTWYPDADGDGAVDPTKPLVACVAPGGYLADAPADCDDTDPDVGASPTFYADGDGDGFGDPATAVTDVGCVAPAGDVAQGGDCDDGDVFVHPGIQETCDGVDQDCDGAVDDDPIDGGTYYEDDDGDGAFGTPVAACALPDGDAEVADDCDDARDDVHPGAVETCDGEDEDCDGQIDEDAADAPIFYEDADGDGIGGAAVAACTQPAGTVATGGDCDDGDATIRAGISYWPDGDGDGHGVPGATKTACTAPVGYAATSDDCDDGDPTTYPGAPDACDGLDESCDGDDGLPVPSVWPTIQDAIDAAVDGDGVCISAGTYSENLDTLGKAVTLLGVDGADVTILDGGGANPVVRIATYEGAGTVLQSLTITNGLSDEGSGVYVWKSSPTLKDLRITGNRCFSYSVTTCLGAGLHLEESSSDVEDVYVWDNDAPGGGSAQGVGVYALRSSGATVRNLWISGNTSAAIATAGVGLYVEEGLTAENVVVADNAVTGGTWMFGGGVYVTGTGTTTLTNASIVGNDATSGGDGGGVYVGTGGTLVLKNADVSSNSASSGGAVYDLGSFSATYSNFYGNGSSPYYGISSPAGTSGNTATSPGYVDTSAADAMSWDLSLATGSSLVDAGDPSIVDADGTRSDVGAYGGPYGASW